MFISLRKMGLSLALLIAASAGQAAERLTAADFANYQGRASFSTQASPEKATIWYGDTLAHDATTPASTFKVFVALVALQTGALKSAEEIVPWNGNRYPHMPEWEKDMNLREAMQSSSESYFGELANRMGRETLAYWVKQLSYGNQQIGSQAERAWLDDVFLISCVEQLDFMERLRVESLAIDAKHIAAVKQAMLSSEERVDGDTVRIYGKTGTSAKRGNGLGVGWYVGFTERSSNPRQGQSFALRIEMPKSEDRKVRIAKAKELLAKLGLLAR